MCNIPMYVEWPFATTLSNGSRLQPNSYIQWTCRFPWSFVPIRGMVQGGVLSSLDSCQGATQLDLGGVGPAGRACVFDIHPVAEEC